MKALEGQVLRVGFPGDSSTGYTLQTDEETGNKTGSVVAFMQRVADRGRFTYEVHNVTDASKAKYTSVSAAILRHRDNDPAFLCPRSRCDDARVMRMWCTHSEFHCLCTRRRPR